MRFTESDIIRLIGRSRPPRCTSCNGWERDKSPVCSNHVGCLTERTRFTPAVNGGILSLYQDNIYALNALTGQKVWNYSTGGAVGTSPAVVNDTVYAGSHDNNIYALNASTGQKAWNFSLGADVVVPAIVANGTVYVGNDDNIYALNASTGQKAWNCTVDGESFGSPIVVGDRLYVASSGGTVYALESSADTSPTAVVGNDTTVTVGETVQFDATASTDDTGVIAYEWDLNGDDTIEATGSAISTTYDIAGTYRVTLTVVDNAGHTAITTRTITAESATETTQTGDSGGGAGGGGSSGGAGGGGLGVTPQTETATLDADGATEIALEGGTAVTSISISHPATGTVTVAELDEVPNGVPKPDGQTVAAVDISAPDPEGAETATVSISVPESRLDPFRAQPSDLAIQHYTGGEWKTLETSVSVTDGTVVLTAAAADFSVFAITEISNQRSTTSTPTPTPTATTTPTPTATTTPPSESEMATTTSTQTSQEGPGFGVFTGLIALLAVVFLIGRRR